MEILIKEDSEMDFLKEPASLYEIMEKFIRENGKKERWMEKEN